MIPISWLSRVRRFERLVTPSQPLTAQDMTLGPDDAGVTLSILKIDRTTGRILDERRPNDLEHSGHQTTPPAG